MIITQSNSTCTSTPSLPRSVKFHQTQLILTDEILERVFGQGLHCIWWWFPVWVSPVLDETDQTYKTQGLGHFQNGNRHKNGSDPENTKVKVSVRMGPGLSQNGKGHDQNGIRPGQNGSRSQSEWEQVSVRLG